MKPELPTYTGPFRQLLTMSGLPSGGPFTDTKLHVLKDAGIWSENGSVKEIGPHEELLRKAKETGARITLIKEDAVALPGFIDSHTHICFAGNRSRDYAMRNAGKSYLDIARKGGGIWDTVKHTREASLEELAELTAKRANELLRKGITTIEVKSGYGLSVADELKMLRAIRLAQDHTKADLVPTCLAAHIVPKDFEGGAREYLMEITEKLFPVIGDEGLSGRVDAFIEESAYTPEDIHPYFRKAQELGWDITVHADQFHTGGSQIAVDYQAVSADHLEASGEAETDLLARSTTIATALPGASLGLGMAFTPARAILNKGGRLAIASDWNPGSAPMGDLLTQAAVLGAYQKLSNAEVFAGITWRAAQALRLEDRGQLIPGYRSDVVVFQTDDVQNILYRQGQLLPSMVIKNGKVITNDL